jgi:mannose-6-phosphate isomerase-like protein (cupin superfamily)
MPELVKSPTRIPVPANKLIDEYIGRVNSGHESVSIAHMHSPPGWSEPGQQPEFDEFTIVLRGEVQVESKEGVMKVRAGQAVIARRGEWVRYSTPGAEGAEYIAVCVPAFAQDAVHRDA